MHFTVGVLVDKKGKKLEELLAPYQENNMGNCPKEFLEFMEATEEINEIGCEKWLSKACKIPKKIGIRELFDPKYLIEIENNFYRYIIENYKEIDIKRENIIFEWETL